MWRRFAAPRHGPARGWGPLGGTSPAPSTRHEVLSDLGSPGPALKGLCCSQPAFGSRRLLLRAITRRAGAGLRKTPLLRSWVRRRSSRSSPRQGQGTACSWVGWENGERRNPRTKPSLQGTSLPPHGDVLLSASRPTLQDGGHEGTHRRPPANLGDRQITHALSVSSTSQPS